MIFIKIFQVVGKIFIKLPTAEIVVLFLFFLKGFPLLRVSLGDSTCRSGKPFKNKREKLTISEVTNLINIFQTTWKILINFTDKGSDLSRNVWVNRPNHFWTLKPIFSNNLPFYFTFIIVAIEKPILTIGIWDIELDYLGYWK